MWVKIPVEREREQHLAVQLHNLFAPFVVSIDRIAWGDK